MKHLLIAVLVLAAMFYFQLSLSAQTVINANINTATLQWDWVRGAPPNDGDPLEWRLKCGPTSGNYTRTVVIADPAARSVNMRTAIGTSGKYFCVLVPYTLAGESGASSELFFTAGAPASTPTNFRMVP